MLVSKKWKIYFVEDDKERLDGANLEDLYKCVLLPLAMPYSSYLALAGECNKNFSLALSLSLMVGDMS